MSEKFPDGWFRDPEHPGQLRHWDGSSWTDERMPVPTDATPERAGPRVNRPSFNAKRYSLPIAIAMVALVTLVAIVASGRGPGSGDDEQPGVATSTAGESPAPDEYEGESESDAGKTVSVGDTLTLGATEYTVKSARQLEPREADSEEGTPDAYIAVELEVVNLQQQTRPFPATAATLIGADDERYTSEGEAAIDAGYDDSLLFNPIEPDEATTGVLVFDAPVAAAEGATLELTDLFGNDKATVDLGL